MMSVRRVETAEDLREYEADKLLHDAYKRRDEMSTTHSYDRLLRKWVDHFSQGEKK